MKALWNRYVYRRGSQVHELWEEMYSTRSARLLYIAGSGFDVRVKSVMASFVHDAVANSFDFEKATLALVEFSGYELEQELKDQTGENRTELTKMFLKLGQTVVIPLKLADSDPDFRVAHSLGSGANAVRALLGDYTDVILDVSSLPRVVYLALMTAILDFIVEDRNVEGALGLARINFQILVAEDAKLDGLIRSEDPSEDLVMIPGYGGGVRVEAMALWPVVWFPILGEGKAGQFEKVAGLADIPNGAEICPVLPHPSRDPRRGDKLLVEYREGLFSSRRLTSVANIMYAHESHPFEAYRQIRSALQRYRSSLAKLGGCRLLVTPLSSKLMTIAAGLACFEMKPDGEDADYALGIPCAAPTRYTASRADLLATAPELTSLVLTGHAYAAEHGEGLCPAAPSSSDEAASAHNDLQ